MNYSPRFFDAIHIKPTYFDINFSDLPEALQRIIELEDPDTPLNSYFFDAIGKSDDGFIGFEEAGQQWWVNEDVVKYIQKFASTSPEVSYENPLTGYEAFDAFLSTLLPKNGSYELWLKVGMTKFYRGTWDGEGDASDFTCQGMKQSEDKQYRIPYGPIIGFDELYALSKTEDDGVFYIPTQPQGLPKADNVDSTDALWVELDHIDNPNDQLTLYQEFAEVSGIEWSALLSSGGKSIHGVIRANEHLDIEKAQYLRRLLVLALQSDPVTVRLHQPVRIPGFCRMQDGQYKGSQDLYWYSPQANYEFDELITGLQKWFEVKGLSFPDRITDEWWNKFHNILKGCANLSNDDRFKQCNDLLTVGIDAYEAQLAQEKEDRAQRREQAKAYRAANPLIGRSLVDQVKDACIELGAEAFEDVDWTWSSENHARGQCCFHEGKSGNSAWLSQQDDGTITYHCTACTNDEPRDAYQYWLAKQQDDNILDPLMPSGYAYFQSVQEFLAHYGIPFEDPQHVKPGLDLIELRIAADVHQKADFWFDQKGALYGSVTREGKKLRCNLLNGNVAAYNLVMTQIGAIWNPKLTCELKVGDKTIEQRGGGHILVIGRTGDGKTPTANAISEISDGVRLYANNQSEFVNEAARVLVSYLKKLSRAKTEDNHDQTEVFGDQLVAENFMKMSREGGQSVFLSGGNAVAFSSHSAFSAQVYRNSVKFWDVYQKYKSEMEALNVWHDRFEFHNPGMLFYNRDAVGEMEKFTGTDHSSKGVAIALMLAGFSTEDTNSYSRGNNQQGGAGNAINTLTRFSLSALTQPAVRDLFIHADIRMGSSKYGMAPRLNFITIKNTEGQSKVVDQIHGGNHHTLKTDQGANIFNKSECSELSIKISNALQRIGTMIAKSAVEGLTTIPVGFTDEAAVIYSEFLKWKDDIDPAPSRYCKDRELKLSQHFAKMCLNAWSVELLDAAIGKTQDKVETLFTEYFNTGITEGQALKVITLMKLHYVEHMIDGLKATEHSSIDGEDSPVGKINSIDTLKQICENRHTLLQWYNGLADSNPKIAPAKLVEKYVALPLLNQFKKRFGRTLAAEIKSVLSGKELKATFDC